MHLLSAFYVLEAIRNFTGDIANPYKASSR